MKIRGKKLTVAQRKTLERHGFNQEMLDSYLMQKLSHRSDDGEKLNQSTSKQEVWTLIHRTTGRTTEVTVGEV